MTRPMSRASVERVLDARCAMRRAASAPPLIAAPELFRAGEEFLSVGDTLQAIEAFRLSESEFAEAARERSPSGPAGVVFSLVQSSRAIQAERRAAGLELAREKGK